MWELDNKNGQVGKKWCLWTVVLEKTLESRLDCKEIQPVNPKRKSTLNIHWKDWCWSWNSNTLATWCEEPTHWERPCCWERLRAGGEGDNRGWDGSVASLTQWTWVWANSGRWWRTGKPGMLQSQGPKELDMTEWLNDNNRPVHYNFKILNKNFPKPNAYLLSKFPICNLHTLEIESGIMAPEMNS